MSFKIPELQNYNGCKGGNGVFQQIISKIPPHKTLVVPFLGHCGITRNILAADTLICLDASAKVIEAWKNYLIKSMLYKYDGYRRGFFKTEKSKGNLPKEIYLTNTNSINWLAYNQNLLGFFYLDPPYPLSTRKSKARLYEYEMTDEEHQQLLSIISSMHDQNIMISSYENEIYNDALKGWNKHSFSVGTRSGKATETIYYNYSLENGKLHDYRFIGNDFKDRERIKLKIKRLSNKLANLPAIEKQAILNEINRYENNK